MYISLLSVREADKMSCFVGIFSIEAHLADVLYMPCRCCFRPYNFKGYGVFKGKEIFSAKKNREALSQLKLK